MTLKIIRPISPFLEVGFDMGERGEQGQNF